MFNGKTMENKSIRSMAKRQRAQVKRFLKPFSLRYVMEVLKASALKDIPWNRVFEMRYVYLIQDIVNLSKWIVTSQVCNGHRKETGGENKPVRKVCASYIKSPPIIYDTTPSLTYYYP